MPSNTARNRRTPPVKTTKSRAARTQTEKRTNHPPGLFEVGLAAVLILCVNELWKLWAAEPAAAWLQNPYAAQALSLYLALAALGLILLAAGPRSEALAARGRGRQLRWAAGLLLFPFAEWIHIFSGGTSVVIGPWTELVFACGLAAALAWIAKPGSTTRFDAKDLLLAAFVFLYPRTVTDARLYFPQIGVAWGLALAGAAILIGLIALLYFAPGETLRRSLLGWRPRLGPARGFLAALAIGAPLILRYGVSTGFYILCPNIRFTLLLAAGLAAAYLLSSDSKRLISPTAAITAAGALVLAAAFTRSLLLVVDDPFSTSWSEGNRLYDYSLVFAQNLYDYNGRIPDPYATPGRYGLWGILYLVPGLPIWAHRLWNALLLTLPSIGLAWLLTRRLAPASLKTVLFFWIASFFIVLAPVHPPFLVAAIIVAAFVFHPSPLVRGAALLVASLYIGISRWTWVLAPGAWGALTDLLLYYPARKGTPLQRLLPALAMAVMGTLPGLLLNIGNILGYSTGESGTAQQPLLWYRLLPNPTLGPGVALLALWTTGPALALVFYWMKSRTWRVDIFQAIAVWGALGAFLAAGLIISTKIGGGGDLHNLDMYLVTLIFVIALGWAARTIRAERGDKSLARRWPAWVQALVGFLLILPVYPFTPFVPGAAYHPWLDFPPAAESARTLKVIRSSVADAVQLGEVLFMDQRQLLTFGYVADVPFIPEYEKKYMMDQALASNAAYFQPYYNDLAAQRFALIVTEPLHTALKGQEGIFAEENDLWVIWVSRPTLCFYEPVFLDRTVDVQLLVPRPDPPAECQQYLELSAR